MRHAELPVAAFLSIPLVLCSLPSHIRAGSICTISLIAWLTIVSIIRGVNSLLWAGNVDVKFQVWCDITTKITIGFTYAIPASALCVLRHLEHVSSSRNVQTLTSDKRRRQMFELGMCVGLPIIGMALHYIVQGHRLDIIEDFGCYPPVYFSLAAIMLLWVPPFLMSLTSFVYAGMALRHFLRRRIEFATHLHNSSSAISSGRYFRLMALAVFEMVWDTGVNAYLIYFNSFTGLRPWISWENVHSNFSRVAVFPAFVIPPMYTTQLIWQWWIVPISCLSFFVFFAFGQEAMSDYRATMAWFCCMDWVQQLKKPKFHNSGFELPTSRFGENTFSEDELEYGSKAWVDSSLKLPGTKGPFETSIKTDCVQPWIQQSYNRTSPSRLSTFSVSDHSSMGNLENVPSPQSLWSRSLTCLHNPTHPCMACTQASIGPVSDETLTGTPQAIAPSFTPIAQASLDTSRPQSDRSYQSYPFEGSTHTLAVSTGSGQLKDIPVTHDEAFPETDLALIQHHNGTHLTV